MSKVECWAAVEKNGNEFLYNHEPVWDEDSGEWFLGDKDDKYIQIPNGTIRRLTGFDQKYTDDPIQLR